MRRLSLVLGVLAVSVVAGCGGGSTTVTQVRTQTSAAALSKSEYIAQADAICQQYNGVSDEFNKKLQELGTNYSSQDTASQAAGLIRQAVDQLRPGVQALQSLQPPPQDAEALGTYVSTANAQLGTLLDLADAYDAFDARQIRSLLAQLQKNKARQQGLAEGYGFKVCGHD
jgi:hypothetical protein